VVTLVKGHILLAQLYFCRLMMIQYKFITLEDAGERTMLGEVSMFRYTYLVKATRATGLAYLFVIVHIITVCHSEGCMPIKRRICL
jgi:hypothetical protein